MRMNTKKSLSHSIDVDHDINAIRSYYEEKITDQNKIIEELQDKVRWFEEQIKIGKARQFGKSSEKSEVMQFEMFPEDQENSEKSEPEAESTEAEAITHDLKKKKTIGRKIDTSKLDREVIIHDLSEEEKCCSSCNNELHKIGEDVSEKIEIVPQKLKVIEHHRIKYACRHCETVKSSPKQESLVQKCMAGNSLITEVILGKYLLHLPLYRQSQYFATAGVDVPPNTLCNWVLSAFEALAPIAKALWEQLEKTRVLQVDETPVKMLSIDKKGYMWVYLSCDPENRYVLFEYSDSRGSHVVNTRLEKFEGILQNDGYSGYNDLRAQKNVTNVGCFAHCRRKFTDVIKASGDGKQGRAHIILNVIGRLYAVEREAKEMSHKERYELRQAKAKPILEELHNMLKNAKPKTPPKSKLGMGIQYALNQWSYLSEYINHGEVEIDNNWVENKIRPFALGRKNWLFVGNQRGADAAALFYSLIETCKLNDVNPKTYCRKLFELAPQARRGELSAKELLPQFLKSSL